MPVVALSGFMGSGKSDVGREAARVLGWRFTDLDDEIERRTGSSIESLFGERGEPAFRATELRTLKELLPSAEGADAPGMVLALGGGTLTTPEAADTVAEHAVVIHLDVPVHEAWNRVAGSNRPLARQVDIFRRLAEERELIYRERADFVVPTAGRPISEVAHEVTLLACAGRPGPESGGGTEPEDWSLSLDTAHGESAIYGGPNALLELKRRSAIAAGQGIRGFLVTDRTVAARVGRHVLDFLDPGFLGAAPREIKPGETSKDVGTAAELWEWLVEAGARRHDVVVAVGGGVIGDVAGFVAATYMRGTRLWQVPTTLVAQVDSSVGGKTAINLPSGKNLVGTFYQPELVVIEPRFLISLRREDLQSGLGEVVKYSLLHGEDMLHQLEENAPRLLTCGQELLGVVVHRCVALKAAVVRDDERDRGRRAILNLGHTAAHALEAALGYGRLPHGVAVGLGLLVALAVSEREVGLAPDVRPRIRRLLLRLGLPVWLELPPTDELLQAARRDKKVSERGSGFVCLEAVGRPVWGVPVSEETLGDAFEVVRA